MNKQKTLKGSFSLFGKGLHTGLNLTITFYPAPENSGIRIQRIDLEGQPIVEAKAEMVCDTRRGTVLCQNDVKVSTVEWTERTSLACLIRMCPMSSGFVMRSSMGLLYRSGITA